MLIDGCMDPKNVHEQVAATDFGEEHNHENRWRDSVRDVANIGVREYRNCFRVGGGFFAFVIDYTMGLSRGKFWV